MNDKREKLSILQTLTVNNLKEICEKNNLKGHSGTKKELTKFMVDNLEISLEELKDIINIYVSDKLLGKIRDGRDHF
jgi:DNA-binding transcriptional regulator WhiA